MRAGGVGGWCRGLPLLQHPHVGGAALSQGQDAIAQADVVEPQAADGGVQRLMGLLGWRGHERFRSRNRGAYGAFANGPASQQQGKTNSPLPQGFREAVGPRAKGLKDQEGSLGGRNSRDGRQRW